MNSQLHPNQINVPIQKKNAEKVKAAHGKGQISWAYFYNGGWWDVYFWEGEWHISEWPKDTKLFDSVREAREDAGIFDAPTYPTEPHPFF
jgi:hypothetical protein